MRSEDRKQRAIIALDPINDVQNAIKRKDWFTGFATSVSYFEHLGAEKIEEYCISNNISGFRDALKNMGPSNIALILRLITKINEDIYSKMKKIIRERNKLIHPMRTRHRIIYRYLKDVERAEELLNQAIECIKALQ